MLTIKPSRYGRPGDLVVATVHAPLVASALIVPTKTFDGQPVFDLGLGLEQADLVELRAAMLKAFRGAYPTVKDIPKLPIRPSGRTDVLWVETFKPPVCLDADDRPTDPPTVGTMIKVAVPRVSVQPTGPVWRRRLSGEAQARPRHIRGLRARPRRRDASPHRLRPPERPHHHQHDEALTVAKAKRPYASRRRIEPRAYDFARLRVQSIHVAETGPIIGVALSESDLVLVGVAIGEAYQMADLPLGAVVQHPIREIDGRPTLEVHVQALPSGFSWVT